MKILITIFLAFGLPLAAFSQNSTPATPKKNFNANIYEKEKPTTVSGKVKSTNTSRGDTSVYFDSLKKSGPYLLSSTVKDYAKLKNRLVKSSGPDGGTVTVTVDDQDQILSVQTGGADDAEENKD